MMKEIRIPKGTKVQGKFGMVFLKDNVYVTAEKESDGTYKYMIGKNVYYIPAGCIDEG